MQLSFATFIPENFNAISREPSFLFHFQKNMALVKISTKIPVLLSNWQDIIVRRPLDLKGVFTKREVFLVWLISAYEFYGEINLCTFVTL